MKPKSWKNIDCKFCTLDTGNATWLEPHIERIGGVGKKTIFYIDYWFCPVCKTMYHLPKHTKIIEEE